MCHTRNILRRYRLLTEKHEKLSRKLHVYSTPRNTILVPGGSDDDRHASDITFATYRRCCRATRDIILYIVII